MPVIHRFGPYVFRIHSNENREAHEPPHVHVESAGRSAAFWLAPVHLGWHGDTLPARSS
jgi:hypothetical protein